jgi:PTS system nitrogen regulatory IIA component
MWITDVIRYECIRMESRAGNREEVLKEIASLAKSCPLLASVDEQSLYEALEAREAIGSTGFGEGIALPHCALEGLEDFVVGLLLAPEGVDFNALDDQRVRIFAFIIGPREQSNRHIQILSALSKMFKKPRVVEELLQEQTPEGVRERLLALLELRERPEGDGRKCLFHVFVQRQELFDEILQIFSSVVLGSIAVLETNNAGYYLHTLPLFSAFWSESHKSFFRIILAVVDQHLTNDVIRRINMVQDTLEEDPGVMIAVQDLSYSSGSVAF